MHELIARQHQFTHQRHQIFQHFDRNANRLLRRGRFGLYGFGQRFRGARRSGRRGGDGGGDRRGFNRRFRLHFRPWGRHDGFAARCRIQGSDNRTIVAFRFLTMLFQFQHNMPNGIHRGENQRNALGRDLQAAIAVKPQNGFRRMRHFLQPRQAKKAASSLDGMHLPKNLGQRRRIIRRAFQAQQRLIYRAKAFMGFSEKISEQIVHNHPQDMW